MKARIFKSLLTPILGISAIVPIAVISTGCNKKKINVESIILKDKAKNLSLRESVQLTATVYPENATNKDVTWTSSNPDAATVNENGVVTAGTSEGETTITVTTVDGGYQATCIISVSNENHVSGVRLDKSQLNLLIGETEQLTATIDPEDATDKRLSWESSDSSIATVSDNGTVRGKSKGAAIIVVTTIDGGHQATCEVNVSSVQGKEITLNKRDVGLYLLDQTHSSVFPTDVDVATYQLKATVYPEDASNKNVIWSSNDPSVATVDENGVVTAVSEGETQIIARLEDNQYISSRCNIKVTNFGILENSIEIPINESRNLHISSETTDYYYSMQWSTDNPRVATVDENGTVTAVGEGSTNATVRIIVEYGDTNVTIVSSCRVYTVKIDVRMIRLEPPVMTLNVGESGKFTVIFTPSDASNKKVIWSSDDPSVATVDENGNIKALSKGRATIKAQSDEDNNKTDEAVVIVINSN